MGQGTGTGSERRGREGTRLGLPRRADTAPAVPPEVSDSAGSSAGMLPIPPGPRDPIPRLPGQPRRQPSPLHTCRAWGHPCTDASPATASPERSKGPERGLAAHLPPQPEHESVTYPHHALGATSAHQPDLFIVCKPLEGVLETLTC